MAVTGIDQVLANATASTSLRQARLLKKALAVAAVAGRDYFLFTASGSPGAATYSGSATTLVQVKGGSTMSHPVPSFTNANSGAGRKLYSSQFEGGADAAATSLTGELLLVDVCAYYQGCVATGNNSMTNTLSIPRYGGKGVQMLIDVQTALGGTGRTCTITYTDKDGNSGATTTTDLVASMPAQTIGHNKANSPFPDHFIPLASGDSGVQSVQSANMSATMGGGTFALVLVKPLLSIPLITVGSPVIRPTLFNPLDWDELGDDWAPGLIYRANAAPASGAGISSKITCMEM